MLQTALLFLPVPRTKHGPQAGTSVPVWTAPKGRCRTGRVAFRGQLWAPAPWGLWGPERSLALLALSRGHLGTPSAQAGTGLRPQRHSGAQAPWHPPHPQSTSQRPGHLERSWLEPRLSTGEMLAEWAEWAAGRSAACLLGDADCDRALALVRDCDRRFFFFSWGLLEGKCSGETRTPRG